MNYSITITNAAFDLTLQTTNAQTIRAAIELADRACGVTDNGPGYAKGTLADVFSREAKGEDVVITIEPEPAPVAVAPDPDVHVDPPPAPKTVKPAAAKKTAKPAAAPIPAPPAAAKEDPAVQILIPSPPENLKALQDETASLTMEAIGRNRPAVIALMGEFGATKFSDIKVDPAKLKGFRARIESITAETLVDGDGKLI
jgi:hypothetical protein